MKFLLAILGGMMTGVLSIVVASSVLAAGEAPTPQDDTVEVVIVPKAELIQFVATFQMALQYNEALESENAKMKKEIEKLSKPKECV